MRSYGFLSLVVSIFCPDTVYSSTWHSSIASQALWPWT